MKKFFSISVLICFFILSVGLKGKSINKETFVYAIKNESELKLDKYSVSDDFKNKPCVIFLFGGGFVSGERDDKRYQEYFNTLAKNGIVVISIDYRKGLSNIKLSSIQSDEANFVELFRHTLDIVTEDLFDATAFIIENSDKWDIDNNKLIISGSSAGAISVLHGEYAIANETELCKKLPKDFRYAGVISFAGAILSVHGELAWKNKPAPMLLFHGNADSNVPYNAVELGYLGFYGSKFIASQLENMKVPYYFYDEMYGGHELADIPMHENLDLILGFIDKQIINNKGLRIHTKVVVNDRKSVNTNFTIRDYFMTNFPVQ